MSTGKLGVMLCIAAIATMGTGCSYLLTGAAVAAGAATKKDKTLPYEEEPPEPAITDAEFESDLVEWSESDDYKFDVRWTVIGEDWKVDREQDAAGNEQVVGRQRLAWMGGPVTSKMERDDAKRGDCIYFLIIGYQENMGGGNFGPTRFEYANGWQPNKHKMRCETKDELAAATPEGQEPGSLVRDDEQADEQEASAEADEAENDAETEAADDAD